MDNDLSLNRRRLLQLGVAGGAGLFLAGTGTALAAEAEGASPLHITDMGSGIEIFTMMSSVMVGDTVYLATRNIEPMQVVGFHLPSRTVTSVTDVFGESTQALAVDPTGQYIYGCVRVGGGIGARLFRIDLQAPGLPMEALVDVADLEPFTMAISPDGVVFLGGRETGPKVRQYDPRTGVLSTLAMPDPSGQYGRSLLATRETVYFGLRARHPETGAAAAGLYSIDRSTGVSTSILPPELAKTSEIRDITLVEDQLVLVNGSIGAIMEVADPAAYQVLRSPINMGKLPREMNGLIYFAGAAGVVEYNPGTEKFRTVNDPSVVLGAVWGLFPYEGKLLVISAFGLVVEIEPETSVTVVHDLIQLGAPVGPQLAMSIAVGGGSAYVGGTNAIARHDLSSGEVRNIIGTDEAKDMLMAGGVLYTAQYSGKGIMAFDPAQPEKGLHLLSALPQGQNRPHDVLWDPQRARLYFGSGSDANVYGALTVFDPAKAVIESFHADPFGDKQQVRTIAQQGSTLFLGGEAVGRSQVLAWDLNTQSELWRLSFDSAPDAVCGLVVDGGRLYVLGYKGKLHVVDIAARAVVHSAAFPQLMRNWGSLSVINGEVYGVTSDAFFRLDKSTLVPEVLVAELAADWFGVPRVAVDEANQVYAIKGRNLIRISGLDTPRVAVTVNPRCVAGKVVLQVVVVNQESEPVNVQITTEFGNKTFTGVQPGKNAFHAFTTRSKAISAGEVQVEASRGAGTMVSGTSSVRYAISECG
ncbi:PQQ-binding-like beta-propeller repeat protein [Arthrobacter sp. PAMC 25486]|uniref:PQQ-binding-like beta-propeller repeat protein n=1 Tax=Arthrobacter sp. PAMC 25486 TaxID=1494608 RepID=UPI00056F2628|nr:PQQ-binding-like beta-propeller repeat protein [Arthrobacter sp. PAMC 25486]